MMNTQATTDFKETEIGSIPGNWNVKQLGELGTLTDGDWILTKHYSDTGVRLLQVGDIGTGTFVDKSERFISVDTASELKCTFIQSNNILISRMPDPIGRACIAPTLPYPTITAVDVSIMAPNDDIDHYFLMHVLNSPINLTQCTKLATGVTRQRVSRRNLETVFLPLPPLTEQRRIAAVLNAIQEAIAAQDDVIAAARVFKRSLMQRLFTYGPDQEPAETKETEIGEIPAHWKLVRLGDVITLQRGYDLPKDERREGTVPIVSSSGVSGTHAVPKVAAPGVVTGRYGTIGEVYYIETDFWPLNTTLFVSQFNGSNERFISYLLSRVNLQALNDKTSIPGVNRNHAHQLLVSLPPLNEQLLIADMIHVAEGKIAAEEDRKTALQALFKSMLHQLMAGRVRLLSDEGLPA
jgi:type I restriction enzyme S subunit